MNEQKSLCITSRILKQFERKAYLIRKSFIISAVLWFVPLTSYKYRYPVGLFLKVIYWDRDILSTDKPVLDGLVVVGVQTGRHMFRTMARGPRLLDPRRHRPKVLGRTPFLPCFTTKNQSHRSLDCPCLRINYEP